MFASLMSSGSRKMTIALAENIYLAFFFSYVIVWRAKRKTSVIQSCVAASYFTEKITFRLKILDEADTIRQNNKNTNFFFFVLCAYYQHMKNMNRK